MDITNVFIVAGAVIAVLGLWAIVGVRHLKFLREQIKDQWEMIDERLRKRNDLVPNMVETLRQFDTSQEQFVAEFIKTRRAAALEDAPSAEKVKLEQDLDAVVGQYLTLADKNAEMRIDTNFLELKKEIFDIDQEVDTGAEKYNEMINVYNSHRRYFFLIPLAFLFGYKNLETFAI